MEPRSPPPVSSAVAQLDDLITFDSAQESTAIQPSSLLPTAVQKATPVIIVTPIASAAATATEESQLPSVSVSASTNSASVDLNTPPPISRTATLQTASNASSSTVVLNMPVLSLSSPQLTTDDPEEPITQDHRTPVLLDEMRRPTTTDDVFEDTCSDVSSRDLQGSNVNRDLDPARRCGPSSIEPTDSGVSRDVSRDDHRRDYEDRPSARPQDPDRQVRQREEPSLKSSCRLVPRKSPRRRPHQDDHAKERVPFSSRQNHGHRENIDPGASMEPLAKRFASCARRPFADSNVNYSVYDPSRLKIRQHKPYRHGGHHYHRASRHHRR